MTLTMIERQNSTKDWYGMTVQNGNFYGYCESNGKTVPCFWSGYTSNGAIAIYLPCNKGGWARHWMSEEQISKCNVLASSATLKKWYEEYPSRANDPEEPFADSFESCIPFFAL